MSVIKICSDTHLGHKNVIKWRDFPSVEEHDNYIIENLKESVNKNDVLWVLGDAAFTLEALQRFNEIKCRQKVLVLGNHDTEYLHIQDIVKVFDKVHGLRSRTVYGRKIMFSHCPIHPTEFRGNELNVHGHTHSITIDDPRYVNVCLEHTDYRAVSLEKVLRNH